MYEQKFQFWGFINFQEQISLALMLLKEYSGIRAKVQNSYDYIFVDEAQDLDEVQGEFLQQIVKKPQCNISIFGDADQTIYGFRGGSNKFMLRFLEIFPNAMDIWLDTNFRSSEEIMGLANCLIMHNRERVPLCMHTTFKTGHFPELISNFRINRIGFLVDDILKIGYSQADIAIIARTNKDLECMCEMLDLYNKEQGRDLKYARPKYYLHSDFIFQTVLDLLKIYQGYFLDDFVWFRLLNHFGVTPQKQDLSKKLYSDWIERKIIYPFDSLEASRYVVADENESKFCQAIAKIYCSSRLFSLSVEEAISKVAAYFFDTEEPFETIEILHTIIQDRYIRTAAELLSYMEAVKEFQDDTRVFYEVSHRNLIHLLTAHDCKGKEFRVVILFGIDDFEQGNLSEDRRLLYVALTRAKERLFLTEISKGKSTFLRETETYFIRKEGTDYA